MQKVLGVANAAHSVLGAGVLTSVSEALNKATGHMVPAWNKYMPKGASPLNMHPHVPAQADKGIPRKVVYVPTCVTRIMGPSKSDTEQGERARESQVLHAADSLCSCGLGGQQRPGATASLACPACCRRAESVHEKLLSLFAKGGYEVIYPEGLSSSCCGMMFNSRGFKDAAKVKSDEMEAALLKASENGKYPIVCDTSPCLSQIKSALAEPSLRFALYEPVEFIRHFLLDKLEFSKVRDSVAVHVPCSSKKMGIEESFVKVASLCAENVTNTNIPCCGMAGDRGMRFPELTGASLQHLNVQGCSDGYSTSRTCEMSLSNHSGVNFRGLVYLVDEATKAKPAQAQK